MLKKLLNKSTKVFFLTLVGFILSFLIFIFDMRVEKGILSLIILGISISYYFRESFKEIFYFLVSIFLITEINIVLFSNFIRSDFLDFILPLTFALFFGIMFIITALFEDFKFIRLIPFTNTIIFSILNFLLINNKIINFENLKINTSIIFISFLLVNTLFFIFLKRKEKKC